MCSALAPQGQSCSSLTVPPVVILHGSLTRHACGTSNNCTASQAFCIPTPTPANILQYVFTHLCGSIHNAVIGQVSAAGTHLPPPTSHVHNIQDWPCLLGLRQGLIFLH